MQMQYFLILIVLNTIWSGSLICYKLLGNTLSTGSIVTLRFGLAAILALAIWPLYNGKMAKGYNLIKNILMGCIVFCFGYRLQVAGNNLGFAENSAILMGLEPLITSVCAAVFLKEYVPPNRWIGFLMGLFGIAFLNQFWKLSFRWLDIFANLLFILSFFCDAAYSVIGKPILNSASPGKTLSIALISGTICNLFIEGKNIIKAIPSISLKDWLLLLYLACLCTMLGYYVWFLIIKKIDVNLAALTILFQPISGIPMAIFLLNEKPHSGLLWGGIMIAVAICIGLIKKNPQTIQSRSS
jgi:drug/metabolite transporter (DMT)-like permease